MTKSVPAMTSSPPITPPTMAPTGVDFFFAGPGVVEVAVTSGIPFQTRLSLRTSEKSGMDCHSPFSEIFFAATKLNLPSVHSAAKS